MAKIEQSIIISYKESNEDRKKNLQKILVYLSQLLNNESEIILVEQGNISKIDWIKTIPNNERINHIFLKNDEIFNKGWGYNVGVKNSNGEKIIFNDIDVFISMEQYKVSLNLLNDYDVVNPYNKIYFLDKENSENFINNNYDFNNVKPDSMYYLPNVISGGVFAIKKKRFLTLKGFDEKCYGYGHEDDIFDTKIRKMNISIITIKKIAVHIYHEVHKDDEYYSREKINNELFMEYLRIPSEQLKLKLLYLNNFGNHTPKI